MLIFALAVFAAVVGLLAGVPVAAAQTNDACRGLDVVFLVDQSGSMLANDSQGVRSKAVAAAIDILGDNTMYYCPGLEHRISVIGFGESPATRKYIASEVIGPLLKDLVAWQGQRQQLKAQVPNEDFGGTDHETALVAAAQVLSDWRRSPLGPGPRRRAVILVTDGEPCVVAQGCTDSFSPSQLAAYMQRVDRLTDAGGPNFPWRGDKDPDSVFMELIGLQDGGGSGYLVDPVIRGAWDHIMQSHGGKVIGLGQNLDLSSVMAGVFLDTPLVEESLPPQDCHQPISIEPYLSNVSIIQVFRRGSNPGVALDDVTVRIRALRGNKVVAELSGGRALQGDATVDDYTRDGPNERYVLLNPPPGQYVVDVTGADLCRDVDVRVGQTRIVGEVLAPRPLAAFDGLQPSDLSDGVVRVRFSEVGPGDATQPIKLDPSYPLDAQLVVTGQDTSRAVVHMLSLVPSNTGPGVFEAHDPATNAAWLVPTDQPGAFTWNLTVSTPSISGGQPLNVYAASGAFSVKPAGFTYTYHVTPPSGSQLQDGIGVGGAQVEIVVGDASGAALGPPTSAVFQVKLVDDQGTLVETQTAHQQDARIFAAALAADAATSRLRPGTYTVSVELEGYDASRFTYVGPPPPAFPMKLTNVSSFTWDLSQPTAPAYDLHAPFNFFGPALAVPLSVHVRMLDGTPIASSELQRSAGPALFEARVRAPGSGKPEVVPFHVSDQPGEFVADWPSDLLAAGAYTLDVAPVSDGVAVGWVDADSAVKTVGFVRQDSLTTYPWLLLALGAGVLLILVVGFVLWNMSGAPQGRLTFVDYATGATLYEQQLGGMSRTFSTRAKALAAVRLGGIRIRRETPDPGKGYRAVYLTLLDPAGALLSEGPLHSGETMPVDADVEVRYD